MIFAKSTALENQKSDTPKLSLQYEQIATDTHTLRSLDWDRSRFDIEFGLRNGTTYNIFLIRGKKTALIDTSHLKFKDCLLYTSPSPRDRTRSRMPSSA